MFVAWQCFWPGLCRSSMGRRSLQCDEQSMSSIWELWDSIKITVQSCGVYFVALLSLQCGDNATAQLSTPQPPHCWYSLWGWHSTERQKCQEYSGVTKLPPHSLQQQPGVWEILCPQRPQTDTLDRELYMKWPTMLEMVLCSTIKKWSALSRQTDASFPPQGK